MKNIKVSDETHKEITEWVDHKEIKITDIIDKLINTGLMTEKYGLSFFQTIIEKEGYISKDKYKELEKELKEKFYEKGYKNGFDLGIKEGIKQFQKQKDKTEDIIKPKDKIIKEDNIIEKKDVKINNKQEIKIPQYNPDDIYGDEKNTRFIRLEQKRKK